MPTPFVVHRLDLRSAGHLRLVMISDTHGALNGRVAALVDDYPLVLHAGDICGAEVLERLAAGGRRVIAVRGNNDIPRLWRRSERRVLERIPDLARIDLPGGEIVMEHGHRYPDGSEAQYHRLLRERHPACRMVVYGHTHARSIDREGAPWVVNPGPCGRTRLKDGPSCVTLDVKGGEWGVEMHHFTRPEGWSEEAEEKRA